jgi:hypothetical protein
MGQVIEQIVEIPEADPVFRLRFVLDSSDEPPIDKVDIECLAPPVETRGVILNLARPTSISLAYSSGSRLQGYLRMLRSGGHSDASVAVQAELEYARPGQSVVEYFQGLLFMRDLSPDPAPVPPAPMPPDPTTADP